MSAWVAGWVEVGLYHSVGWVDSRADLTSVTTGMSCGYTKRGGVVYRPTLQSAKNPPSGSLTPKLSLIPLTLCLLQRVISATKAWISTFVRGYNLCPFADQAYRSNRVRYRVFTGSDPQQIVDRLQLEVRCASAVRTIACCGYTL
jgi:hypothetical protein